MTSAEQEQLLERVQGGIAEQSTATGVRVDWWRVPGEPPRAAAGGDRVLRGATVREWRQTARGLFVQGATPTPIEIDDLIEKMARELAAQRRWLIWAARYPAVWMRELLADDEAEARATAALEWWSMCVWASESLHRAITAIPTTLLPADRVVVEPMIARLRFLVLTEPWRHLTPDGTVTVWGDSKQVERLRRVVFGQDTWDVLLDHVREARWAWFGHLDGYTGSPPLATASDIQLEQDLRLLVFAGCSGRPGRRPLTLRPRQDSASRSGPDDAAVQRDVIERHLLPRFRLSWVFFLAVAGGSVARSDRGRARAAVPYAFAVGVTVLAATAGWFSVEASWLRAGYSAAAAYVLLTMGILVCGQVFATPWLLRWPASAALGLIALVGLAPSWWQSTRPLQMLLTACALVGAAWGYLVIEVRNHGVGWRGAVTRGSGVLVVGAVHSTFVALFGLLVLFPAFADDGDRLSGMFTGAEGSGTHAILAATAAWCLCAGVFSQILWDDRSIAAPLAHGTYRSERPR